MQPKSAHVLFIDDQFNVINEAQKWLVEVFKYQNLETATSTAEALEKLRRPFDVIIADMRMEKDDSGFTILNHVQEQGLSSVVIVLTANDTVQDCRNAFKRGAWDYISKNMRGNAFDALNESIKDAISYLNRWGNQLNEQWFKEVKEAIERDYWGQHIAILNRDIIEFADTEEDLRQRLVERQLRRFTTTIRKIGDLKPIVALLKLEESDILEFKSSLQWSTKSDKKDDKLSMNALKTIAAFLNSRGGTLLLGVEDDGGIFGLEKDYSCLKKPSRDKFQLHLVSLIESKIGKLFLPYIKIRFESIQGKDVCAVYVRKSDRVALIGENTQLRLYLRTGNSSRPIKVPETYNYL